MDNKDTLNRKLAEWAGFRPDDSIKRHGFFWVYPDGDYRRKLPDFTQSLDACFKWLVPMLDWVEIQSFLFPSSKECYCSLLDGNNYWKGKGETPALALCLAILKLIERDAR